MAVTSVTSNALTIDTLDWAPPPSVRNPLKKQLGDPVQPTKSEIGH